MPTASMMGLRRIAAHLLRRGALQKLDPGLHTNRTICVVSPHKHSIGSFHAQCAKEGNHNNKSKAFFDGMLFGGPPPPNVNKTGFGEHSADVKQLSDVESSGGIDWQ